MDLKDQKQTNIKNHRQNLLKSNQKTYKRWTQNLMTYQKTTLDYKTKTKLTYGLKYGNDPQLETKLKT